MARSSRILLALAATVLLAVPGAYAQGGVLPGVTVTATSPAQIGALTAVTNEAGI